MKHFITVTGTRMRYGTEFAKRGMEVILVKEPENEFDKEAIRVEIDGIGKIGYVANSVKTVIGDCMSAGRLYDRIGMQARARIQYIMPGGLVCSVKKKDILYTPPVDSYRAENHGKGNVLMDDMETFGPADEDIIRF